MVRLGCSTAADSEDPASGDVMTRVTVRLSCRSLAFYYGKVPGFTHSSLREYKPADYFSFYLFFPFEQPSLKMKFSMVKISSNIIVSFSFVQKIGTILTPAAR